MYDKSSAKTIKEDIILKFQEQGNYPVACSNLLIKYVSLRLFMEIKKVPKTYSLSRGPSISMLLPEGIRRRRSAKSATTWS